MKRTITTCLTALGLLTAISLFGAISTPTMANAEVIAQQRDLRAGDVVFQITDSDQSMAVFLATGSPYTHCGIVLPLNGQLYVFEAVGPVKWTPIDDWIAQGENGHYVIMAPASPAETANADQEMPWREAGDMEQRLGKVVADFQGKPYDSLFQWSDDAIYCSELVWKIYQRAFGIDLAPLKTFRDYELDHDTVQALIHERTGGTLNLDERVIAPSDLMESPLLSVVKTVGEQPVLPRFAVRYVPTSG